MSGRFPAYLLVSGGLLAGCATTHSLTPLAIDVGPAVREYKSPDLSSFRYATFSVFPLAAVNPNASLKGEGEQRIMLFSVRNLLEANGYRFVRMDANPDFVVGVDASIERTEGVTRRTVVAAPDWQPGNTLPSPPASLAALQAADTWGWGTMPDTSNSVAQLPEWPPRGKTKSGPDRRYTVSVKTSILDARSLAEVWVGTGSGISRSREIGVAAQLILWMTIHQFPATSMAELTAKGGDLPGLNFEVFTNDGKSFYPGVVSVDDRSPAWRAGVLPYDMVLAVGGEAAWNRTWPDVRRMLGGPAESKTALTLWRNGTQVNVEGRRVAVTAGEDAGAVAAPPESTDPSKPKKQARLEISRSTVAVGNTWAVLGGITIVALVAAMLAASK
jgi:hypothetical protein